MNMDELLQTFITESRELLDAMEGALLNDDPASADKETINAIFRSAHTIKGSAGLFGLEHVVSFSHLMESVLDGVRDGRLSLNPELVNLMLSCCDHVRGLIEAVAGGQHEEDAAMAQRAAPLAEQLRAYLPTPKVATPAARAVKPTSAVAPVPVAASDHWHLSLRIGADVMRCGMDVIALLRYLATLGRIVHVQTLHEAMPVADAMDPEVCYLGFELSFDSQESRAAIEAAFAFIVDESSIQILSPHAPLSEYADLLQLRAQEKAALGPVLLACGSLNESELAQLCPARDAQPASTAEPAAPAASVAGSTAPTRAAAPLAKSEENRSIRIDADKLDHLINRVGELIIAAASTNLIARRSQLAELQEQASTLSMLVEEVRESALQLRMVKIGATFSRFKRVVHDVARELGKDIQLLVSGEDAELDKTVVERITDPLTHLVRNAIDHGIESAETRQARGKPAVGTIRLNAYHDSGRIVIEVSDDGGGLKRERILAKAAERGLIEAGRSLSDREIYELIFEPGFSTADKVTNLSGRGVGMDVVKRNIVALRGSVEIRSQEGEGTTVAVRLPLTLAIIEGFLVSIGTAMFVIPLEMIEECVKFSAEPGRDYTSLRGGVLPFLRLRELLGLPATEARENIVVVRHAGQRFGLVVNTLHGEFQTVIKPLGPMFNAVPGISGSSILGSGEVALILDVPALLRKARSSMSETLMEDAAGEGAGK